LRDAAGEETEKPRREFKCALIKQGRYARRNERECPLALGYSSQPHDHYARVGTAPQGFI